MDGTQVSKVDFKLANISILAFGSVDLRPPSSLGSWFSDWGGCHYLTQKSEWCTRDTRRVFCSHHGPERHNYLPATFQEWAQYRISNLEIPEKMRELSGWPEPVPESFWREPSYLDWKYMDLNDHMESRRDFDKWSYKVPQGTPAGTDPLGPL